MVRFPLAFLERGRKAVQTGGMPVVGNYGEFGEFQLVGHGKQTNEMCGTFSSYYGCLRVDLHNIVTVDGHSYSGKVFARKVFHSCDKPSCPVCFKKGWAVREARRIEVRLGEASKRFGQVEHVICSVPYADYGLNLNVLRKKVAGVLSGLGVVGGVLIFHAFSYKRWCGWFFRPHFHVLGFILGGYRKCRRCLSGVGANCLVCDGFNGRCRRGYKVTRYIVKVAQQKGVSGVRETVGGTAWYQLNHASIVKGVKRFHVATWFGVCSYRKLKVSVEVRKVVCPICGYALERLRYCGHVNWFVGEQEKVVKFFADFLEGGFPAWAEVEKRDYG